MDTESQMETDKEADKEADKPTNETAPKKQRRKTPDWTVWHQRPYCHLADAVALSMNIHPRALISLKNKVPRRHSAYLTRLKTASLSTSPMGPILEIENHPDAGKDTYHRVISLHSFVQFAKNQAKWLNGLPEEFLALGVTHGDNLSDKTISTIEPESQEGEDAPVVVTLPYITDVLKKVFDVMRDQHAAFQSDRPPKQINVGLEIAAALGDKPSKSGKPNRRAEILAAVIRPDHLKEADSRAR